MRVLGWIAIFGVAVSACSFQDYEPHALNTRMGDDAGATISKNQLDDPDLQALITGTSPEAVWTLESLTKAGVSLHPDIAAAKSRVAIFEAGLETAGQHPNPAIGLEPEYHSKNSEFSSSPWSWGLIFEIPLSLPSKRLARLDEAAARVQAARLEAAGAVWRLRSDIRSRLVDLYAAQSRTALAAQRVAFQEEYLTLLERYLRLGEASRFEVSTASLRLNAAKLSFKKFQGMREIRRTTLAARIGIDLHNMTNKKIDFAALQAALKAPGADTIRQAGLRNRLDIRRSLALYAAAEARLRLEIANQYPDFTLSPGILWDQGDMIWRLGTAMTAPFFNINQGPIAEARAARRHAGDRFIALQASVLADLTIALATHRAALETWKTAEQHVDAKKQSISRLRDGQAEIDRLTLATAEGELLQLREALLNAKLAVIESFGAIEDAVERPLDGSSAEWMEDINGHTITDATNIERKGEETPLAAAPERAP